MRGMLPALRRSWIILHLTPPWAGCCSRSQTCDLGFCDQLFPLRVDELNPVEYVRVGLGGDLLHPGVPCRFDVVVRPRLVLVEVVPVYRQEVSIDPGGTKVVHLWDVLGRWQARLV